MPGIYFFFRYFFLSYTHTSGLEKLKGLIASWEALQSFRLNSLMAIRLHFSAICFSPMEHSAYFFYAGIFLACIRFVCGITNECFNYCRNAKKVLIKVFIVS